MQKQNTDAPTSRMVKIDQYNDNKQGQIDLVPFIILSHEIRSSPLWMKIFPSLECLSCGRAHTCNTNDLSQVNAILTLHPGRLHSIYDKCVWDFYQCVQPKTTVF